MREVMPELIWVGEFIVGLFTGEELGGFFVLIELPMRDVALELMRVLGLGSARLVVLELLPVGLLLLRERLDGA